MLWILGRLLDTWVPSLQGNTSTRKCFSAFYFTFAFVVPCVVFAATAVAIDVVVVVAVVASAADVAIDVFVAHASD